MSHKSPDGIVLEPGSALVRQLTEQVTRRKVIAFVGLPGVGKSLMVQQATLIAQAAGRRVHLLQWDVARLAFECDEVKARFPEVDGVTHAGIRLAVGRWVRTAVAQWLSRFGDPADLLLVESALVGNRLIELAQRHDDPVEATLASEEARFLVPAPTREVRSAIEAARRRDTEQPKHAREAGNAAPNVLDMLMREIHQVGLQFGIAGAVRGGGYDPEVYMGVYSRLLRNRHFDPLWVDQVLEVRESAYQLDGIFTELEPAQADVARLTAELSQIADVDLERQVARWYEL